MLLLLESPHQHDDDSTRAWAVENCLHLLLMPDGVSPGSSATARSERATPGRCSNELDQWVWLQVSGGTEEMGRSFQKAVIDRVCDRAPPELRVGPSSIPGCGQGLFAERDFACGELVLELYGALVPRVPSHARPGAEDYLFGLNERFQVDPIHPAVESKWRLAWAINHSCSPNLAALKSNLLRLGFSSREAAHMRQPLAPRVLADEVHESAMGTRETRKRGRAGSSSANSSPGSGPRDEEPPKKEQHKKVLPGRGEQEQGTAPDGARQSAVAEPKGREQASGLAAHDDGQSLENDVIFFVATTHINRGEELFFDYRRGVVDEPKRRGAEDGDDEEGSAGGCGAVCAGKICRCLSPMCRGVY